MGKYRYDNSNLSNTWGWILLLSLFIISLIGCEKDSERQILFQPVASEYSGLTFSNSLTPTAELNCYTYKNFYNGGGVALADFNGDSKIDIFLTGNQVSNKLYFNQGDLKFIDFTIEAGLASTGVWSSGATAADVDGDGDIDLFVCKSGAPSKGDRHNQLFLNDGKGTFTDVSDQVGLSSESLSTQATFFDVDADGDLDMYLLSNSLRSVGGYDLRPGQREIPDTLGGNKFFLNRLAETGSLTFEDATAASNIYASAIGFGLGVAVSDIDEDQDLDIYVCNDFFERDYLYLNDGTGKFTETLPSRITTTSLGSMGADAGDLNGDGHLDLVVTDMLPASPTRYKAATRFDSWSTYANRLHAGYHHQVTRNTVQLNRGDGYYAEVGRQLGLQSSDWSWGALMFDAELDGDTDVFIANGIGKDLTDQDYIHFDSDPKAVAERVRRGDTNAILELLDKMPSVPIDNALFINDGNMGFAERGKELGVAGPGYSNGVAYADLDADGDLDLVVNNVNAPVSLFENQASTLYPNNHFIGIELRREGFNNHAIGARVELFTASKKYVQEVMPTRGFQSCVSSQLLFGLGEQDRIDSIRVTQHGYAPYLVQNLTVDAYNTIELPKSKLISNKINLVSEYKASLQLFDWTHRESTFSDFDKEKFRLHMGSTAGPGAATADLNGDNLPDFFLGGGAGQKSELFISEPEGYGKFSLAITEEQEAIDAHFFDADQDGDLDLYIANGSSEFSAGDSRLQDQLLLNTNGQFSLSNGGLPIRAANSTAVESLDLDKDGDLDLLVVEGPSSDQYGGPGDCRVLINESGTFRNVNPVIQKTLSGLGQMTDMAIVERNDTSTLVAIVGEWMPLTFVRFRTRGNLTIEVVPESQGWYQSILAIDMDKDGQSELILGNLGHNSLLSTHTGNSFVLERGDFDRTGSMKAIVSKRTSTGDDPIALLPDLYKAMPSLRARVPRFSAFAKTTSDELLGKANREISQKSYLLNSSSSLVKKTDAGWEFTELPFEVQQSPVYALNAFTLKGKTYLLGMGNLLSVRPEIGPYLSSQGSLFEITQDEVKEVELTSPCLRVDGEIRSILGPFGHDQRFLIVRNNDLPVWWSPSKCNLP